jgi:hypothetical protein
VNYVGTDPNYNGQVIRRWNDGPGLATTLSRRDADRVEQALAGNRELAERYELVRQELAGTALLNATLGAPSARAMEKLFAAISAEEAHGSRCRDSARDRLH